MHTLRRATSILLAVALLAAGFAAGAQDRLPPLPKEQLTDEHNFSLSLYEPVGAAPEERRFKIYRKGAAISLSAVLPVLNRLGVEVIDERPYELRCSDRTTAWIYDFGLRMPKAPNGSVDYAGDDARERIQDAFAATWTGQAC